MPCQPDPWPRLSLTESGRWLTATTAGGSKACDTLNRIYGTTPAETTAAATTAPASTGGALLKCAGDRIVAAKDCAAAAKAMNWRLGTDFECTRCSGLGLNIEHYSGGRHIYPILGERVGDDDHTGRATFWKKFNAATGTGAMKDGGSCNKDGKWSERVSSRSCASDVAKLNTFLTAKAPIKVSSYNEFISAMDVDNAVIELERDITLRCCIQRYCGGLKATKFPCDPTNPVERHQAARDRYGCPCEHEIAHSSKHSNQDTVVTIDKGHTVTVRSAAHHTISVGGQCRMFKVSGQLNLDNVALADTTQYASGSGIAIYDGGVVNADRVTLRNHRNNQHQGGAFYVAKGGALTCNKCRFLRNDGSRVGGGALVYPGGRAVFKDSYFDPSNRASAGKFIYAGCFSYRACGTPPGTALPDVHTSCSGALGAKAKMTKAEADWGDEAPPRALLNCNDWMKGKALSPEFADDKTCAAEAPSTTTATQTTTTASTVTSTSVTKTSVTSVTTATSTTSSSSSTVTTASATTTTTTVLPMCKPGQRLEPATAANAFINSCKPCPAETYRDTPGRETKCVRWHPCEGDQHTLAAATAVSDYVCTGLTECTADQYEVSAAVDGGSNRVCAALRDCVAGQRVDDSDPAQAAPGGEAMLRRTENRKCVDCASGTWSKETNQLRCNALSTCTVDQRVRIKGRPDRDLQCGPCASGYGQDAVAHRFTECNRITTTRTTGTDTSTTASGTSQTTGTTFTSASTVTSLTTLTTESSTSTSVAATTPSAESSEQPAPPLVTGTTAPAGANHDAAGVVGTTQAAAPDAAQATTAGIKAESTVRALEASSAEKVAVMRNRSASLPAKEAAANALVDETEAATFVLDDYTGHSVALQKAATSLAEVTKASCRTMSSCSLASLEALAAAEKRVNETRSAVNQVQLELAAKADKLFALGPDVEGYADGAVELTQLLEQQRALTDSLRLESEALEAAAAKAALSSAGAPPPPGGGGGSKSNSTVIMIAVVLVVLIIAGAAMYVVLQKSGGGGSAPVGDRAAFDNPLYSDAVSGANAATGYMDVPAAGAATAPVPGTGGSSGYMDVAPAADFGGFESDGEEDV